MKVRTFFAAAAFLTTMSWSMLAFARTTSDFAYPVDKVWNASVRLVRVDLGCALGDRDTDAGYFMFEYADGAHRYPGSLEIVRARVEGRDGVRVVVQIPAMPSYVERMILDRLGRKLIDEFGEPAPIPTPPPRESQRRDARDDHAGHDDEDDDDQQGDHRRSDRQRDNDSVEEDAPRERNQPARPND
ncbi:MAG: hypothetical protein IPK60_01745 [Sandaracinaceae bacterium]|nr:hypothetical protein [Sandaracinaceae bacterium]